MKAELVYNTEGKPRILLTLESFEETARMAYEPNLDIVTLEESVGGPTKMAFAIVPSHARERHTNGDIQPLSTAERKNPAHAMGGGKSEADYQRFIQRYEATVEECLDECLKRERTILERDERIAELEAALAKVKEGLFPDEAHDLAGKMLIESIQPCRDCNALGGEPCEPDCTQKSYL